jgi:hypothetical protein
MKPQCPKLKASIDRQKATALSELEINKSAVSEGSKNE